MAYLGNPLGGIRGRFIYTATAGQTTFSGTDDHNRTLSYTDAEFTDVFLNGVKLDKSDYTATSGTSIVLDSGATAGDTLEILGFDTFSVFSGEFSQDVTVGGSTTLTGDLTVDTSTLKVDSTNNTVGVGTVSPHSELDVRGVGEIFTVQGDGGASAEMNLSLINGTVNKSCIINFGKNLATSDRYLGRIIYEVDNNNMDFYTNGSNKFRIQTSGNIVQTSSISAGWSYAHNMTASSGQLLGNLIQFTAQAPNNSSNFFLYMTDNVGPRAYFTANGGLHNYQGNNSNLSDEREKKNIEDAQDAWATVKSWQVRKFHFNEDADSDDKRYGVIAQEFETSCPELISEFNRSPDPTSEPTLRKGVKEQGAMWLAIKALQEAQAKIETLETKVAALEAE